MEYAPPDIEGIEIIELLGKGGMSLVYKARQTQLDRIVAIKILLPDSALEPESIKRFQNEARLTGSLNHANIVKTISFGISREGKPYLVMEYLQGVSLADEFKKGTPLTPKKFRDVFLPALSALACAHEKGLTHRDIKPANIMICQDEAGLEQVKLVDFGIAKFLGGQSDGGGGLTRPGAVLGTPSYMSPEQCLGQQIDARSDLYSLACVMYEALCGRPPFAGDSALQVMQKHCNEPVSELHYQGSEIPVERELAEVIVQALSKEPPARPQSATAFAHSISAALEGATLDKVPGICRSRKAAKAPLIFLLGALLGCGALLAPYILRPVPVKNLSPPLPMSEKRNKFTSADLLQEGKLKRELQKTEENTIKRAHALDELGTFYLREEKSAPAEELFSQSLKIREKLGPSKLLKAITIDKLARCRLNLKRPAEAKALLDRSLSIRKEIGELNSRSTIDTLDLLSVCYGELGDFASAEKTCRRALQTRKNALARKEEGFDEKQFVARTIEFRGGRDAAESYTQDRPFISRPVQLIRLAEYYLAKSQLAESEKLFKILLAAEEHDLVKDSREVARILNGLSQCYHWQGRQAEADACLLQSRKARQGEQ